MTAFLTLKEVASRLRMHEETIRRYVREKRIPAKKIGKAWLVTEQELNNFIKK